MKNWKKDFWKRETIFKVRVEAKKLPKGAISKLRKLARLREEERPRSYLEAQDSFFR